MRIKCGINVRIELRIEWQTFDRRYTFSYLYDTYCSVRNLPSIGRCQPREMGRYDIKLLRVEFNRANVYP